MYQFEEKEIRKNKTNIFVRKCITEALFSLLEKHDFEDISITDIIKKAGVSRMGFYRNYSSKEDVIEKFILEKFIETINEIKAKRQLNFHINNIIIKHRAEVVDSYRIRSAQLCIAASVYSNIRFYIKCNISAIIFQSQIISFKNISSVVYIINISLNRFWRVCIVIKAICSCTIVNLQKLKK